MDGNPAKAPGIGEGIGIGLGKVEIEPNVGPVFVAGFGFRLGEDKACATGAGDSAVISIPERLIPSPDRLVGDVGVIFSDAEGMRNASRIYLFSRDTGLVSDIPCEAKLLKMSWREWK